MMCCLIRHSIVIPISNREIQLVVLQIDDKTTEQPIDFICHLYSFINAKGIALFLRRNSGDVFNRASHVLFCVELFFSINHLSFFVELSNHIL